MLIVTRLTRVIIYRKELPPINLEDPLVRWSCEVAWQIKHIYPCRRPVDTKLGKVLTCSERLLSLKPGDPLIRWSHLRIWKFFIFVITRLMISKTGRMIIYGRRLNTQMFKWSPTSCSLKKHGCKVRTKCFRQNDEITLV